MDVLSIELQVRSVLNRDDMITCSRTWEPTEPTNAALFHDDELNQLRPTSATLASWTWHLLACLKSGHEKIPRHIERYLGTIFSEVPTLPHQANIDCQVHSISVSDYATSLNFNPLAISLIVN